MSEYGIYEFSNGLLLDLLQVVAVKGLCKRNLCLTDAEQEVLKTMNSEVDVVPDKWEEWEVVISGGHRFVFDNHNDSRQKFVNAWFEWLKRMDEPLEVSITT